MDKYEFLKWAIEYSTTGFWVWCGIYLILTTLVGVSFGLISSVLAIPKSIIVKAKRKRKTKKL